MASILGSKGQVVIEKPIRDALGLEPGFVSSQTLVGDHIEIRFFPPEHDRSLRGILSFATKKALDPERWDEVRSKAWVEAARESWLGPSEK